MSEPIARLNAALTGRYRIERQLGEGGMATVYLADDLRHERKVAVKVLKPELAVVVGAERFLAEIKTTANLQHPHILPLFDSGEADGFLFYVMPYVEGESLRERLDREKQLPVDEAVRIASDVSEALAHAHRQSVIHRDIKPANILLTDGRPLVSDFGIALAVGSAGGGRLTETGLSLGTPHYMSPEQATGDQNVGAATDFYALGCVLYEMLVGEPPYTGSTPQAILGKIISGELVPVTEGRPSVPAHVGAAIAKALEKIPADRFQSAEHFTQALRDTSFRHAHPEALHVALGRRPRLPAALIGAAAISMVALYWSMSSQETAAAPFRLSITMPVGHTVALADEAPSRVGRPSLALSPDGSVLAFVATDGTTTRLFVRRLDDFEARALSGTDGAYNPFFSPDGEWVGFFTQTELKKISLRGGTAQTLANVTYPVGADWAEDGTIVFAQDEGRSLLRVSDAGGSTPETIVDLEATYVWWPKLLPGDTHVVGHNLDHRVVAVSLVDGTRTLLLERGTGPQYVHSGHLVYSADGGVMARPFDPSTLEFTGPAVFVAEPVRREGYGAALQLTTSDNGRLAYVPGDDLGITTPVWYSPGDGSEEEVGEPPRRYGALDVSPDGRLAAVVVEGSTNSIWLLSLDESREALLLTPGDGMFGLPVWAPDSRSLVYSMSDGERGSRARRTTLLRHSLDEGSAVEILGPLDGELFPEDWSVTGDILFDRVVGDGDVDAYYLPAESTEPVPWLVSPFTEWAGRASPDGNWAATASEATGQLEVFVTAFPEGTPSELVSTTPGIGKEGLWSADGEYVYFSSGGRFFRTRIHTDGGLIVDPPEFLFEGPYATVGGYDYDVGPDGRFFLLREPDQPPANEIRILTNSFAELERLSAGN